MEPVDIYKRAVAAMHAIQAPAYLQFDTHVTTTVRDAVILQHLTHVERTRDENDVAYEVDENIDLAERYEAKPFEIAPDLFLAHAVKPMPASNSEALPSGLDDLTEKPLKIIAVVSATLVHYNVSTVGTEELTNCASAIHLKLDPLKDPLIYNLRDLWVDPGTSRVCKAVAVWQGHVNRTKVIAPVTLSVDGHGFINHYSTSVRARFLTGGVIIVQQEASYDDLHPVEESVWSAFDSEHGASDGTH